LFFTSRPGPSSDRYDLPTEDISHDLTLPLLARIQCRYGGKDMVGKVLQRLASRFRVLDTLSARSRVIYSLLTFSTCPPNLYRIADRIFLAKSSSFLELNR